MKNRIVPGILALIILAFSLNYSESAEKTGLKVGDLPPNIVSKDINGENFDLRKMKNKVVLIDFWATWCGPCRKALPEMKELHEKYASKGLEIVGISADRNKETLENFIKKEEMGWRQIFEGGSSDQPSYNKYGVNGIPHVFLIGKKGKIIAQGHPMNLNLDALIKKELKIKKNI